MLVKKERRIDLEKLLPDNEEYPLESFIQGLKEFLKLGKEVKISNSPWGEEVILFTWLQEETPEEKLERENSIKNEENRIVRKFSKLA